MGISSSRQRRSCGRTCRISRGLLSFLAWATAWGFWLYFGCASNFLPKTLTPILPLMLRKDFSTFVRVLQLWAVVLCANLLGTYLFALCVGRVGLFDSPWSCVNRNWSSAHWIPVRLRFCSRNSGGLADRSDGVAATGCESARVSIIIILTYIVGLGAFNHIVAGSTTVFFLIVNHSLAWSTYFLQFFIPTLAGNILGGVALVAALGHAQVVGGKSKEETSGKPRRRLARRARPA